MRLGTGCGGEEGRWRSTVLDSLAESSSPISSNPLPPHCLFLLYQEPNTTTRDLIKHLLWWPLLDHLNLPKRSVHQLKNFSGRWHCFFLLAIFCVTFCHILSRLPFGLSGLWRWITTLTQMEFFADKFIFKVRNVTKIEIYSVTGFYVFKFCPFNSDVDLPSTCGLLTNVVIQSSGFWQSILTSFNGGVYISVLLSISFCWLVHCLFYFEFHHYIQLLLAVLFPVFSWPGSADFPTSL